MPAGLPQADEITQADLRRAVALELELSRLQRQLNALLESFYVRLKAGARVEEGTHTCIIEHFGRGVTRGERVKVR
jgi:uncharacterized protein YceH (UPF0502 family)